MQLIKEEMSNEERRINLFIKIGECASDIKHAEREIEQLWKDVHKRHKEVEEFGKMIKPFSK